MAKIELGDKVKEVVTGFTGVVTGIASYLTGCDQACVTPRVKEDGSHVSGQWYDVTRLEVLKKGVVDVLGKTDGQDDPGGPQFSPPTS